MYRIHVIVLCTHLFSFLLHCYKVKFTKRHCLHDFCSHSFAPCGLVFICILIGTKSLRSYLECFIFSSFMLSFPISVFLAAIDKESKFVR